MDFEEVLRLLFGPQAGTRIHSDLRILITRDHEGQPRIEILGGETVVQGDGEEGAITRLDVTQDLFFSCGCPRSQSEIGARCDCGRISCSSCASRCANPNCRKPLCTFCVVYVENAEGELVPLCGACADEVDFAALMHRASFGLLPPAKF